MTKKSKYFLIASSVVFILSLTLFYLHRRILAERDAACPNCRSFIHYYLMDYADEHDGYFPHGGKTPLDSLAQCIKREEEVHFFTSHLRANACREHWKKYKSLNKDVTIYRYNEGLHSADPPGLILLYYYKETDTYKGKGRPVMLLPGWHWTVMKEDDFQKAQKKTEAFLRKRKADTDKIREVRKKIILRLSSVKISPEKYKCTLILKNIGSMDAEITTTGDPSYVFASGSRTSSGSCLPQKAFLLKPGETHYVESNTHKLPVVTDDEGYPIKTPEKNSGKFSPDNYWLQEYLNIRISSGKIKNFEVLLISNKLYFLKNQPNTHK